MKMTGLSNSYEGGGTKTVSMFSKLMNQGSSFVMEGVKNLVVKKHVSSNVITVLNLCTTFQLNLCMIPESSCNKNRR